MSGTLRLISFVYHGNRPECPANRKNAQPPSFQDFYPDCHDGDSRTNWQPSALQGHETAWPHTVLATLGAVGVFVRVFSSWTIWIGIASLIAFVVSFMLALSVADYSYVQPAAAVGYLVIAVLGVLVLGEKVSPLHWAGIVVICLGVSFIRGTNPRTTETPN